MKVNRQTVDLSGYPDLAVIYLGMRVNTVAGIKTLFGFGPKISKSAARETGWLVAARAHFLFAFPVHVGMRQYWRDFESLERWSRSEPHLLWWKQFLRDSGGTGFWHETYTMRGGMEAIYDDIPKPLGFSAFAPVNTARGPMFSARSRAKLAGEEAKPNVIAEGDLYK